MGYGEFVQSSIERDGLLTADHTEDVGEVGDIGTSGAGDRLREVAKICDN